MRKNQKRSSSRCEDEFASGNKSGNRSFRDKNSSNSKTRSRSRNSKNYSKAKTNTAADVNGMDMPGFNDISWYSKYPELVTAAANIPFPYRPGMNIPGLTWATSSNDNPSVFQTYNNGVITIGGVLAIHWAPSFGQSSLSTDPASVLGKEMYARVRANYSGSLDADAPDFVMYLGALDSIFSYISYLKRLYRLAATWSPQNYLLPDTVLRALGFGPAAVTEIQSDRKQLLEAINLLVMQSRKFKCPAVIDYFNRHYWMNDNIYCDANSTNSQLYIFVPDGFFKLSDKVLLANDPSGSDTAAGLLMQQREVFTTASSADGSIVRQLYNFGLDLIQALDQWDDGYTISGYLQRAFSDSANFTVELLSDNEQQDAIYSEEVLTQIENCRSVGGLGYVYALNQHFVAQNVLTNAVYSMPYVYRQNGVSAASMQPALSLRSDSPLAGDVIIASRLHGWVENEISACLTTSGATTQGWYIHSASEIVSKFVLWTSPLTNNSQGFELGSVITRANAEQYFMRLTMLEQFDWHPIIYAIEASATGVTGIFTVGDVHNITPVSETAMDSINRVCLLSEFSSFSI